MIISENNKPAVEEFKSIMKKTDLILNGEAIKKELLQAMENGGNSSEESKGCGGVIGATGTLVAGVALIGTAVIALRKKED